MHKLSSLTRFKASCPFLARTKTPTLISLSNTSSASFPSISALTERATKCPIMGPSLNVRSKQIVAGYASVAASDNIDQTHRKEGGIPPPGANVDMCPHASAAHAARMAHDIAAATAEEGARPTKTTDEMAEAAAAGCPFAIMAASSPKAKTHGSFDYPVAQTMHRDLDKHGRGTRGPRNNFSGTMNRASVVRGTRHSGARSSLYKHNDPEDLEAKLQRYPKETLKSIAFEGIYPMSDRIKEICHLTGQYGDPALDEVHTVGRYRPRGAGVAELSDLNARSEAGIPNIKGFVVDRVDIITGKVYEDPRQLAQRSEPDFRLPPERFSRNGDSCPVLGTRPLSRMSRYIEGSYSPYQKNYVSGRRLKRGLNVREVKHRFVNLNAPGVAPNNLFSTVTYLKIFAVSLPFSAAALLSIAWHEETLITVTQVLVS